MSNESIRNSSSETRMRNLIGNRLVIFCVVETLALGVNLKGDDGLVIGLIYTFLSEIMPPKLAKSVKIYEVINFS